MTDSPLSRRSETVVGTFDSARLERIRSLTRLLDSAIEIPNTRFRFGLDAVVGLVPGLGDLIGGAVSTFLIVEAARLGVPRSTLLRMIGNVGLDTVVGEIPLLGDLFDFGWKSNTRNLALLEQHLERPAAGKAASRRMLLLVGGGVILLVVGAIALGVVVANFLLELLK
jgi:hypothetical protein